MSTAIGRVVELRAYPVKSLAGPSLERADVGGSGLAGDRAWAVVDADGEIVSGRRARGLRQVAASGGAGGEAPQITLPGAESAASSPAGDAALSAYLGETVHLEPSGGLRPEVAVHVVSRQAVAASIGTTSDDPACELAAPRANVVLDFGAEAPDGFERAWLGRELVIGDLVLRITSLPKHCLGVYAEVVNAGPIAIGAFVVPGPFAGDSQTPSEWAVGPG